MKLGLAVALATMAASPWASAAPAVFSGVTTSGAGDPAFIAIINSFRADLGGALNPPGACSPSPCVTGRREVNWDAVPDDSSSPNAFPGNFFNGTAGVEPAGRQRGLILTTPGTGFRVSATEFSLEATFNAPAEFDAFSPARLFASMGSPITDVTFAVPGSPGDAATVKGFGVVFADVDYTGSASMEFFDSDGNSLDLIPVQGVFANANGQNSQGSFSFLGVSYHGGAGVARVRIVSGSHGIDGIYAGSDDAVVMDDFIFAEPVRRAIPEPGSAGLALLSTGLLGWSWRRRTAAAVRGRPGTGRASPATGQ